MLPTKSGAPRRRQVNLFLPSRSWLSGPVLSSLFDGLPDGLGLREPYPESGYKGLEGWTGRDVPKNRELLGALFGGVEIPVVYESSMSSSSCKQLKPRLVPLDTLEVAVTLQGSISTLFDMRS